MRATLLSGTALAALTTGLALTAAPSSAATMIASAVTSNTGNLSSYTLNIPLFNESLGNLQSVVVTETLAVDYGSHNGTFSYGAITGTGSPTGTATTALDIAGSPSDLTGTGVISVMATEYYVGVGPTDSAGSLGLNVTNNGAGGGTFTDVANWETGTIGGTDPITLNSYLTGSGLSNATGVTFSAGAGPDVNVTVSMTYNYTTNTPEPATLLTLGAGVIGLGVARRRRKLLQQHTPAVG
jgi:hypothetical protein